MPLCSWPSPSGDVTRLHHEEVAESDFAALTKKNIFLVFVCIGLCDVRITWFISSL